MTDAHHESVAEIEMLYQQRMTVKIPVDNMPASPEDAFRLVKNTDPEFVADALPSTWADVTCQGHLEVVDISEEDEVITGGDHPNSKLTEEDVLEIKQRLDAGEAHVEIAEDFPVGSATVDSIAAGELWQHVEYIGRERPGGVDDAE